MRAGCAELPRRRRGAAARRGRGHRLIGYLRRLGIEQTRSRYVRDIECAVDGHADSLVPKYPKRTLHETPLSRQFSFSAIHVVGRSRCQNCRDDVFLCPGYRTPDKQDGNGGTFPKRARPARIRIDGTGKGRRAKSAQGMAVHMLTMGQPWGARAYRDWLRNYAALLSFANSRTASRMRQAAAHLCHSTLR